MMGSHRPMNREAGEGNGCLCRHLANWARRDPHDPNVDLSETAGMGHLNLG